MIRLLIETLRDKELILKYKRLLHPNEKFSVKKFISRASEGRGIFRSREVTRDGVYFIHIPCRGNCLVLTGDTKIMIRDDYGLIEEKFEIPEGQKAEKLIFKKKFMEKFVQFIEKLKICSPERRRVFSFRVENLFCHGMRRGGVIPYIYENGAQYWCLGLDRASGQFSDFGGRIVRGESALDGSLREFREESLGVFEGRMKNLSGSTCVTDSNTLIIFSEVEIGREESLSKFRELATDNSEMSDIVWVDRKRLEGILKEPFKMYQKVRSLFLYLFR